jgi:putative ubiquitin-RnfH superfamily antitoxin RatB of RatAB toxin-antitoxin module
VRVVVAFAAPGVAAIVEVTVGNGSTVADAVAASGIAQPINAAYAIFGQRAAPDTPLVEGDRIEITRPLVADAKAVRRARAADNPLPPARKTQRRG